MMTIRPLLRPGRVYQNVYHVVGLRLHVLASYARAEAEFLFWIKRGRGPIHILYLLKCCASNISSSLWNSGVHQNLPKRGAVDPEPHSPLGHPSILYPYYSLIMTHGRIQDFGKGGRGGLLLSTKTWRFRVHARNISPPPLYEVLGSPKKGDPEPPPWIRPIMKGVSTGDYEGCIQEYRNPWN